MTATAVATKTAQRLALQKGLLPAARYFTRPVRLLRQYDRTNLRPDLIAGLTVAVILLPQAIAFALIAELPPAMGLYAAVVGGLVGAFWGSSNQANTGPTNAISLLILSTLSGAALPGTPEYVIAAGMLALLVGLFQLFLGLARLGVLVNFVSHSVIVGFASGAGLLIAIKQIGPLLGLSYPSHSTLETLTGAVTHFPETVPYTAAIGIGTIVFLLTLDRLRPQWPGPLLAMIFASLLVFAFGLHEHGVDVIGSLPTGLPPLARLPYLDTALIGQLLTGAVAVGAIGLVETTAIAKSIATQTRQRLDSNQEFVGQGMANIFSGLFTGFAVAGSFSRTAVNFRAGARTPIAAVISSLFVLVAMQFLGPFAAYLPVSALAGVLIVTAYRLIDREEMARIMRGTRGDAVIMVVTFAGTLFLHIETAVIIGILLSFVRYIIRTSSPRVNAVVPDEAYSHFIYAPERDECPQLAIIEIMGDLYFGAVNHVEEFILEHAAENPEQRFLLIRMNRVNNCDFSGIHMLESVVEGFRERGGDVFLVRVSDRVRVAMESTGFDRYLGQDHFLSDDSAIRHLFHRVLDPAVCIYECPVRVFSECQNLPKRLDLMPSAVKHSSRAIEVSAVKARDLWEQLRSEPEGGRPLVVDVREPREFRGGHIVAARSLPLPDLGEQSASLPTDRPIVFVCRSGRRSRLAAATARRQGLTDISLLEGGMLAWEAAGLLEAVDTFAKNGGA